MRRRTLYFKFHDDAAWRIRLLLLAALFAAGLFLGLLAAGRTAEQLPEELRDYLQGYLQLSHFGFSPESFLSVVWIYFRYPLLAALLGFASLGLVLIPLLSFGYGFFLAFSVGCMTRAFGKMGPLLALCMFGLRSAVTVFCFFWIAVPALGTSGMLANLSFGIGRRSSGVVYGRDWWMRLLLCSLLLIGTMCVEFWSLPGLLLWLSGKFVG